MLNSYFCDLVEKPCPPEKRRVSTSNHGTRLQISMLSRYVQGVCKFIKTNGKYIQFRFHVFDVFLRSHMILKLTQSIGPYFQIFFGFNFGKHFFAQILSCWLGWKTMPARKTEGLDVKSRNAPSNKYAFQVTWSVQGVCKFY